jgi:hypothetical protein
MTQSERIRYEQNIPTSLQAHLTKSTFSRQPRVVYNHDFLQDNTYVRPPLQQSMYLIGSAPNLEAPITRETMSIPTPSRMISANRSTVTYPQSGMATTTTSSFVNTTPQIENIPPPPMEYNPPMETSQRSIGNNPPPMQSYQNYYLTKSENFRQENIPQSLQAHILMKSIVSREPRIILHHDY